jgi:uroporphyrinogen-III decarboxylase
MRGTRGMMLDLFRHPEKILDAVEALVPIMIRSAVMQAEKKICPIVYMPLHKGTKGFMSDKQFQKFYWPTLKKVMLGLIDQGLVPLAFAEGDYTERLEYIQDLPSGSVIWLFENMDMPTAKQMLKGTACIAGNVPVSLLCTGTPAEVKNSCRDLIENVGADGGYILAGAASMNEGNPDNLRAMMDAAKEFGRYCS